MAEKYVSASELRKLLGIPSDGQCTGCPFVTLHGCRDDSLRRACEAIDDAPAANVRSTVRGKWEGETGYIFSELTERLFCPMCGSFSYFGPLTRRNFCPNCGADMREVKSDGD